MTRTLALVGGPARNARVAAMLRRDVTTGMAPAVSGSGAPDARAAALHLRRLRYFRDLLVLGVESTIWPDRAARTLRSERLALGIDFPELDAVALWSTRCGEGLLAIPFADFILARARDAAAWFEPWDGDGTLRRALRRLERAVSAIAPAGALVSALPRLEEVRLPEEEIAALCGTGGLLDRIVGACESMTLGAGMVGTPEAS